MRWVIARRGVVRCGDLYIVIRRGVVRCGVIQRGVVQCGAIREVWRVSVKARGAGWRQVVVTRAGGDSGARVMKVRARGGRRSEPVLLRRPKEKEGRRAAPAVMWCY